MSLRTYPSVWVIRIVRSKSFCSISIHRQSVSIEAGGTPCVPVPFFSREKIYINTFHDYAALCANQCDSEHCNYLTYEEMSLQHMWRSINFGYPQFADLCFIFLTGIQLSWSKSKAISILYVTLHSRVLRYASWNLTRFRLSFTQIQLALVSTLTAPCFKKTIYSLIYSPDN